MNVLSIFKKKKPLWETDIVKFLEQAGEKELNDYTETLPVGREIDFTSQGWGHAYTADRKVGAFAHYGSGFYGSVLGSKGVTKGDFLLLKTASEKVGKYLVLNVEYVRDPNDMFWAYVVCVGYKNQ